MKTILKTAALQIALALLGLAMVYPIVWLALSAFKTNQEIFGSIRLLPKVFDPSGFVNGWRGSGQYTFTTFYRNSLLLVGGTVAATIASSTLVAYGFARFNFRFRNVLFILMLSTMMLPTAVVVIPRFIMFRTVGWINTYLPFIVPAALAAHSFFIFMLVQFFRGIPTELDESAFLDGCGSMRILLRIILPLAKPALVSAALFKFIWTWNDFFDSLIYINSVKRYPVSLALKMVLDINTSIVNWNQVIAMAVLAMVPSIVVFFVSQRSFVEGIATTGIKG